MKLLGIAATLSLLWASAPQALEVLEFSVSGDDVELEAQVRSASLLRAAQEAERTDPRDLIATAKAEYRVATAALFAAGHYGGVVQVLVDGREAATLSPLNAPERVTRIEVRVRPGPQFTFGAASVQPIARETQLPKGFASGAVAKSAAIGEAAQVAIAGWRAKGHAKADLENQSITANHTARTLSARLLIAPGPKLRFARPTVSGNSRTRTDRILEIAGLPEGDTFSPDEMEDAASRLRRSGAFRSVALSEGERPIGDTLPIGITVIEQKRRRLGFGVELSSNEGLTLSGFWLHRNLFGGAERLRIEAEAAQIGGTSNAGQNGTDLSLAFRFERPATLTPDTSLFLTGSLERIEDPGYTSRAVEFGGGLTHRYSDTLEVSGGLTFSASRVSDTQGTRDFRIAALPFSVTRDTRNTALDATSGSYLDLEVTPFAGLSGTSSGLRLVFDGRAYRKFSDRITVAGRAQLGALWGPDRTDAPPDMLFFAGGGGSVRGLPYQSLGVPTTGTTPEGGRSFLGLSGEIRGKVTDTIGLVGFVDAGYIGAESFVDGSGNWGTGAGIGLRYLTPIGPIRLDVATPISGAPTSASDVQLYIGIGQAF